jgi:hypothetical protein
MPLSVIGNCFTAACLGKSCRRPVRAIRDFIKDEVVIGEKTIRKAVRGIDTREKDKTCRQNTITGVVGHLTTVSVFSLSLSPNASRQSLTSLSVVDITTGTGGVYMLGIPVGTFCVADNFGCCRGSSGRRSCLLVTCNELCALEELLTCIVGDRKASLIEN